MTVRPLVTSLIALTCAAAHAASPAAVPAAPAADKQRVLVLDLDASGVDAGQVKLINGLVTDSVARFERFEVISSADVRQLVAMEADKSAAGCDTSSCLAEVAGALGAQKVVFGNLGRLGNLTIVTLSLFDTKAAKAVGRQRLEVRDIETLPHALDTALSTLMGEPLPKEPPPPALVAKGPSPLFLGGAIGGGVAAVVALGATGYALSLDDSLGKAATSAKDKQTALDNGPAVITAAAIAGAVAAAGGALVAYSMFSEGT